MLLKVECFDFQSLFQKLQPIVAGFDKCAADKKIFASTFKTIEEESNKMHAKRLIEPVENGFLVVNPPAALMTTEELDDVYRLPFTRLPHPRYQKKGAIPAYEMIKFSVNIHRGCFGGCSFFTISAHQGKFITSRSAVSIIDELTKLSMMSDFKGNISDLGGPSANMYRMQGKNLVLCEACKRPSCAWPALCPNLNTDHNPLSELYKRVRDLPFIKKATIGSGVRYDLFADNSEASQRYKSELIKYHVSGRLKVAPEHTNDAVLRMMRKPSISLFKKFYDDFTRINNANKLRQQLVPYFISSHPGCTIENMRQLAAEMKSMNLQPEQVQDFTPSPMTLSSVMFYTGLDPYSMKQVFVDKKKEDKLAQKDLFFWKKR